jgi:hypothetical protein
MSEQEALQLAASIIAQAHHPNHSKIPAYWMPPEHMPLLDSVHWKDSLTVKIVWGHKIEITNATEAHVGRIKFQLNFRSLSIDKVSSDLVESITDVVDILPRSMKIVDCNRASSQRFMVSKSHKLVSVEILEAYGMRSEDYKK